MATSAPSGTSESGSCRRSESPLRMIPPAKTLETKCVIRAVSWALIFILFVTRLVAEPTFVGAPPPVKPPGESPRTAEEEQKTFTLPPGFQIELVAAEPNGGKFVAISFDHAGRLWTMTALEYPLDANESPAEAKALFARGGRDRVIVFDTPAALGRQQGRVFAEGLAIPLGLL